MFGGQGVERFAKCCREVQYLIEMPRIVPPGFICDRRHVIYVGVSNQFGSARSMATWDKAYEEFHGKRGFSAKPALLGISRGGLYVNAWARLHPDRVSVLYLDKLWPTSSTSSSGTWNPGLVVAYRTGRGSVKMRASTEMREKGQRQGRLRRSAAHQISPSQKPSVQVCAPGQSSGPAQGS